MRLKTENYSYDPTGLDHKLSQAIDVNLPRNNNPIPKTDRTKPSFPEYLRHSTDQSITISNLLGKGYKYFEPRSRKPTHDFSHVPINEKFQCDTSRKYDQNEP